MTVIEVKSQSDWNSLHKNALGKLVVVDFWATWCGPCKQVAPIFSSLSDKLSSHAVFAKLDVDEEKEIAQSANVTALPSFGFYVNGKLVELQKGGDPRALEQKIKDLSQKHFTYAFKGQGNSMVAASNSSNNKNSIPTPSTTSSSSGTAPTGGRRPNPWANPDFFPKSSAASPSASSSSSSSSTSTTKNTNLAASTGTLLSNTNKPTPAPTTSSATPMSVKAAPSTTATIPSTPVLPSTPATPAALPSPSPSVPPSASAPPPTSTGPRSNDSRLTAGLNPQVLKQLTDMGFPLIRAEKALILNKSSTAESALNWLMAHENDVDIDEPLQVVGTSANHNTTDDGGQVLGDDDMDEDERVIFDQMRAKRRAESGVGSSTSSSSSSAPSDPNKKKISDMTSEEKMQWLADRRAAVKAKKEAEGFEQIKQSEKSRRGLTMAVNDMKEKIEEDHAKKAYALKKKEEAERLKARNNIREKIAADKERRKIQQQRDQEALVAQKEKEAQAKAVKK